MVARAAAVAIVAIAALLPKTAACEKPAPSPESTDSQVYSESAFHSL